MTEPWHAGTSLVPEQRQQKTRGTLGARMTPDMAERAQNLVSHYVEDLVAHLDAIFGDPLRGLAGAHRSAVGVSTLRISGAAGVDRLTTALRASDLFSRVKPERWTFVVAQIDQHIDSFYDAVVKTDVYVSGFVTAQLFVGHIAQHLYNSLQAQHLVDGGPTAGERARAHAEDLAASYVHGASTLDATVRSAPQAGRSLTPATGPWQR